MIATTQISSVPKRQSPLLTVFTVLKPFVGENDVHQRNALASWDALSPDVEILLFSDTEIPQDICSRFECFTTTNTNSFGTPLLDEVFRVAAERGCGQARAFINADIMIDQRFLDAGCRLMESELNKWLAIGRRTEFCAPSELDFDQPEWIGKCFCDLEDSGTKASIVCKDYFMFSPELFCEIPPFAVGRGNWDNWMVRQSKDDGIPVIDIGEIAPVLHQRHGYSHVRGGRLSAYVSGIEAKENQRLAGGRHLVGGSTPDWRMDENGVHHIAHPTLEFVKDLACFGSLVKNVLISSFRFTANVSNVENTDISNSQYEPQQRSVA